MSAIYKDGQWYGQSSDNSQPSSSGGHAIKDKGTDITQRDTLNLTDFDIEDNSTDEETDVAPHRLTAGEIAEIVSPLPTVPVKGIVYSTEERVIGKWIDGKPLYQKTVTVEIPTTTAGSTTERDLTTDETFRFIHSEGVAVRSDGTIRNIHSIGMIVSSGNSSIPITYDVLQEASNKHIFLRYRTTTAQSFTQTVHVTVRYIKTTDVAS